MACENFTKYTTKYENSLINLHAVGNKEQMKIKQRNLHYWYMCCTVIELEFDNNL